MLQDRRGGSGRLLNLMRVNNDLFCDLAAYTVLDDSTAGELSLKFLRYKNVPGLAVRDLGIAKLVRTVGCSKLKGTRLPHVCAGTRALEGHMVLCWAVSCEAMQTSAVRQL